VPAVGIVARARVLLWLSLLHVTRAFGKRGYYRVCAYARKYGDEIVVQVAPGAELIVPVGDIYWNLLLEEAYEPEVGSALEALVGQDAYLLDLGANIGYWTMIMAQRVRGVVAVEASPATYARLAENADLNRLTGDPRVTLLNAAIWNVAGQQLTIHEHRLHHAAASVHGVPEEMASTQEWDTSDVATTTIAELVERYCSDPEARIVIKLDVEGTEIEALDGAGDLLHDREVIVIYEDHGRDLESRVSQHIQELGLEIFDLVTGSPLTLKDVVARKTEPRKGYNFGARSTSAGPFS
jgi:FkbM family methyltransferase